MERHRQRVAETVGVAQPVRDPIGHLASLGLTLERGRRTRPGPDVAPERMPGTGPGAGRLVGVVPERRELAVGEVQRRVARIGAGHIANVVRLDRVELAERHDRVRGRRARQHRHEGHVEILASGAQPRHRDVIRPGRRPELMDDRLDHGIRRNRPREGPHDPAEALRFCVAALDLDPGGAGVEHSRRDQRRDRDR